MGAQPSQAHERSVLLAAFACYVTETQHGARMCHVPPWSQ